MDWIIGQEWKCPKRGLSKKVLSLEFKQVQKPTELSTCLVKICNVANLENRSSSYLQCHEEFVLEMGTATTPIDYYIELLIQNMMLGETSQCLIKTKCGESINFEITLISISHSKYLYQLDVQEIYELAQKYRANGVQMYKTYPNFAHEYFSRAAKCLISYKPFENLTKESKGVDGADMESLLQTLQTNIAACLLQLHRNEDVLYLTKFVETLSADGIKNSEKAVYRRALAFYNVKAYDKALAMIDKVDGIQQKKEFLALYNRTKETWKQEEEHYKSMFQRMFNKV